MEPLYGLVAVIVVVIIVALGLASASNRAEVAPKEDNRRKRAPKEQKSKPKKTSVSRPATSGKKEPEVTFGSADGKYEDEDESMVELLTGTSKYQQKEAEEAQRKAKSDAKAQTKKENKTQKKQQVAVDDSEDNSAYVAVGRPKKGKADAAEAGKKGKAANADEAPQNASDEKKRAKKAFLKSEVPEKRKPGDKPQGDRPPRQRREENGENAGDEQKPRPRRREPELDADGNEIPRVPRERKPIVYQAIPAPLQATAEDVPSLDEMLGAFSKYPVKKEKKSSPLGNFVDKEGTQ